MQLRIFVFSVYILFMIVCIQGHTLSELYSKQNSLHAPDRNKRNSLDERTVPSNFFTSFVLSGISSVQRNSVNLARQAWHRIKRAAEDDKPTARSLDVVGRISSRFAETEVTSVMENPTSNDLEAEFELQIPETAFISSFVMTIDGKDYVADVKEKHEAQEAYDEAKEKNKTAGQISSRPRDQRTAQRGMEIFAVAVNVAARSVVRFQLIYQQALERVNNVYRYILSIRPRQLVDTLTTNIYLYEPQGFSFLEWKLPGENDWSELRNHDRQSPMQTHSIEYNPNVDDQTTMNPIEGIAGDLIIEYDVNQDNKIGLFQAEDGYFTHYFSPTELTPLGKNIVFVIDISGSMTGRKIEQTRQAMLTVLSQLREEDYFKIILFHTDLEYFPEGSEEMVRVTADSKEDARKFIRERLSSGGGTNLNGGLIKGCEVLQNLDVDNGNMIVFLTDGQPTAGETDPKKIQSNVRGETEEKISVHSLGFGYDLDYDLLKKISWMTNGYVQRIYEAQDAAKQLEDFYNRIGTPVLFNIEIEYDSNVIQQDSVSNHIFPQYYDGSEMVVVGKLQDSLPEEFDIKIEALSDSPVSFAETLKTSTVVVNPEGLPEAATKAIPRGFLEKFYVYMRIKELYRRTQIVLDDEKAREYYDEALQLALDYKLVTPLTSMIIVQDDPPEPGHLEDGVQSAAMPGIALDSAPNRKVYSSSSGYSGGSSSIQISQSVFLISGILLAFSLVSLNFSLRTYN